MGKMFGDDGHLPARSLAKEASFPVWQFYLLIGCLHPPNGGFKRYPHPSEPGFVA